MATSGVEFADVSFTVGDRSLLREVSFRCEAGSTTALLGRSGSGKTTLLRTVNRLVAPTSGRVLVKGQNVADADVLQLRRGIGYVIQESGLFPHLTVQGNVELPLAVGSGMAGHTGEAREAVRDALDHVGLPLAEYGSRYPWQLSGGQRQRAGVARALVRNPEVMLMDEPFGALDPLTRAEMQRMTRDLLRSKKVTTLIVTHDLQEALFLADRVVLMENGAVRAEVATEEVMNSVHPAVREYVQATQPREVRA